MTGMPIGSARVWITAFVWAKTSVSTRSTAPALARVERCIKVMASAAAVASSRRDDPAISRPVRSVTIVWKLTSASSRPWEISG